MPPTAPSALRGRALEHPSTVLPAAGAALTAAAPGWIFVLALLGLAITAEYRYAIPLERFMRDPMAELQAPFYTGVLSHVGVLLWTGAAAVCFFCGGIVAARGSGAPFRRFLFCSGLLTSLLLLDDLFLLHEEVFPNRVGIPEKVVLGAYGSLALLYLFRFRDVVLRAEPALLALALGCFAVSVLADARFDTPTRGMLLLEDGAKLLGIVTWLMYFARVGSAGVRRELSRAGT